MKLCAAVQARDVQLAKELWERFRNNQARCWSSRRGSQLIFSRIQNVMRFNMSLKIRDTPKWVADAYDRLEKLVSPA
jgi:hypothetical protein